MSLFINISAVNAGNALKKPLSGNLFEKYESISQKPSGYLRDEVKFPRNYIEISQTAFFCAPPPVSNQAVVLIRVLPTPLINFHRQ